MPWIYKQSTGLLSINYALFRVEIPGYSGFAEGKNNPAMQSVVGRGPIPQGWYTINAPQDKTELGPCALPLTPSAANKMFGRSDFWIHDDSLAHPGAASKGCIITTGVITRKLIDLLRTSIGANTLQVIP